VATSVNTVLAAGFDRDGNVPVKDLFSFDASSAATSISVTDIDTSELAAASTGAPGGNGNALALDDLSRTPLIDNYSPSQFYGSLAGRVGRNLANSRIDEQAQSLMLSQSRSLRASETEVSIDEEAANIVAFQRQYEANAELIRILNSMTETTINIIR
jgi:flagellar hook-associated protein 1 FlgK